MYYIGIDVGGTNLVAGLVDADGRIRDKASRPVPRDMTARQFGGYLVELAEQVDGPHTVVLHQNPLGLIAAVNLVQKIGGEVLGLLDGDDSGV